MVEDVVGVISELGRLVDVPTPAIDTVYALVKQRTVEAGCLPGLTGCPKRFTLARRIIAINSKIYCKVDLQCSYPCLETDAPNCQK